MNFKKFLNVKWNRLEYKFGVTSLRTIPTVYTLGISNICNLKCPLCITGIGKQDKPLKFMEYQLFQEIIEKIKDNAKLVQLYNWGEPFLHKDIIKMLELCNQYDLNTEISSNLSLKNIDHILEATVKYRLKTLIVSFDGISQEDYERYRVNGDFDLVLKNILKINEFKKIYDSEFPVIKLQYLKNKFTTNQDYVVSQEFSDFGADDYVVYDMLSIFKNRNLEVLSEWFTEEQISNSKYLDIPESMLYQKCPFLYNQMIIEQDGSIPPCCFTTDKKDDFSSWNLNKTIKDIFNSEKFMDARKMFRDKKPLKDNVCSGCSVFLSYCEEK